MSAERAQAAINASQQGHPIASMLGAFFGGFLLVTILAIVLEKALFQRVNDDPVMGKLSSVVAAWILASILGGFGMANGGSFNWFAFVLYGLPAIVVGFWFYHRGRRLREQMEMDDSDLGGTFR